MTTRSYSLPTYRFLPSEDSQLAKLPETAWVVWEKAGVPGILGHPIGPYPIVKIERLSSGLVGARSLEGKERNVFLSFESGNESLTKDLYRWMSALRTLSREWSDLTETVTSPQITERLEPTVEDIGTRHPVVDEFASGSQGKQPHSVVVDMAERIVQAAVEQTDDPDFLVDFDGALSVDLRMHNGLRVLAELTIAGELDVGFYVDSVGPGAREVKYLPEATVEELIGHLDQNLWQYHQTM